MSKSRRLTFIESRIDRAVRALDEIAKSLGDEWDNYAWDTLSSARQALREFDTNGALVESSQEEVGHAR